MNSVLRVGGSIAECFQYFISVEQQNMSLCHPFPCIKACTFVGIGRCPHVSMAGSHRAILLVPGGPCSERTADDLDAAVGGVTRYRIENTQASRLKSSASVDGLA